MLTGGRAPATLDLARILWRGGHEVHVAESLSWPPTRWSRAVSSHTAVPAPNQDPEGFATALLALAERTGADTLIPTCEEVFWVSRVRDRLSERYHVVAEPLDRLRVVHSKALFIERAREHGLAVPETRVLTSRAEALATIGEPVVLKPEFSRFATHVVVKPRSEADLVGVEPTAERRWVAQRFLSGKPLCTWGVADKGRLVAHCDYAAEFTAGKGATLAFAPARHPGVREWVERFVAAEGFSGLIAFDFVDQDGEILPLECNPRLTSGVHLFVDQPEALCQALLEGAPGCVEPGQGACAQLSVPMAVYGLPKALGQGELARFARIWWGYRDVALAKGDPWPMLGQIPTMVELSLRALRRGVDPMAATTLDIEWNGD